LRLRLRKRGNGDQRERHDLQGDFRVFFATDIHGSDRCFKKFLAAARVYEADSLILGGDIAGKAVVPFVAVGGGRYAYKFQGESATVAGDELEEARKRIQFTGLYPLLCSPDEASRLEEDIAYRSETFERVITEQIRSWLALADERLADEVRCIITPGNDDPLSVDAVLRSSDRVECPEASLVELGPIQLASLGNTNRTPWETDREYDEGDLARQIDDILGECSESAPLVLNFHCPPYGSGLDTAAQLDDDFTPVVKSGSVVEIPVGSTAVRDAIERYEPVVGLHGHIHEAEGTAKIAKTLCINPGSMYGSGWLKGAIVDFDASGRCSGHLLTSG
jgi:Icc-related predicted phosphoesterase